MLQWIDLLISPPELKKPGPGVERLEEPDERLIAKAKAGCQ